MHAIPVPHAPAVGRRLRFPLLSVTLLGAALGLTACGSGDLDVSDSALAAQPAHAAPAGVSDPVQRGEYLVKSVGCNDCHTPWKMGEKGPEPDMSRMLSGHPQGLELTMPEMSDGWMATIAPTFTAFGGPFGISYAANLTPDATGLGAITEEMFTKAIREGKHYGTGRPLLPPMPWMWYRNLTDDDLHAVWAYLQTIPAIQNTVPQPLLMGPPPTTN